MNNLAKFAFSLILLVIVGYGVLVWFVNSEVEKELTATIEEVDGLAVSYDDLWVEISDSTLVLTRPTVTLPTGEIFAADELTIHSFDPQNPIPHFVKAQAKGLVIQAKDAEKIGLPMDEDLRGDLLLDYGYTPGNKSLTLNTLSFDDTKFGRAELSGTVTELDLNAFRMEKLIGLRLGNAKLTFTDREFVNTLLGNYGTIAGASTDQVRQRVGRELGSFADIGDKKGKSEAAKTLRALKDFIEKSGTVTVRATPMEPVPYMYLFMGRDIYDNIELFGLSIERNSDS